MMAFLPFLLFCFSATNNMTKLWNLEVHILSQGIRVEFIKKWKNYHSLEEKSMCTVSLYCDRYNFRWQVCLSCCSQRYNNLMPFTYCLETINSTFFVTYYISQKTACIRNSPTLNCYVLGNGLCLCTWKQLIL